MKIVNLNNKNIRFGGYQTIVAVIIIAIAIAVNVIFSGLNLKLDLTEEKFFSLSPKTEEVVKGVTDDITLYVLEETGTESSAFKEILVRYDKLNSHVSLVYKDPILYPQFTQKYIDENTPKIDNGSIIVENNVTGKFKVLTQTDFYSSTGYGESATQSLAVENAVTSAISYVVSTIEHTLYISSGHGELNLPKTLTTIFSKTNMPTQNISLSTEDLGDPSTSTLIIYSPHTDFNEVEFDKITNFLDAGGKALIFTDYDTPELKNFNALLNYYGIKHSSGAVVEAASSNMLSSYPTYLIPNYSEHDITNSLITNNFLYFSHYLQHLIKLIMYVQALLLHHLFLHLMKPS
ncbi:Gldg family protein [Cellulosilyticum ruminicola]|uniref:Gldg family protein n=1 Tax=Cellulosilyticum ruminicola TaxID=425254 RepID=UPI0006D0B885|nr:Gldg family protein [Cellulosilyticum ruminicola]